MPPRSPSPEAVEPLSFGPTYTWRKTSPQRLGTSSRRRDHGFPRASRSGALRPTSWGLRSSLTKRRICWTKPKSNWAIPLNCGSSAQTLDGQRRASGRQRLERPEPKPRAVFQSGSPQAVDGLATEFLRLQDLPGASRLWSRLAEQEPNDLDLRLKLLDLAFQTANSNEIDKNIKQIEQIEGNEGFAGRCCQVRYLIWQAERADCQGTARSPATADQSS